MTKYVDKDGLAHYTAKMKTIVNNTAKSAVKPSEDWIASVKNGNKALVTPSVTGKWTVYDANENSVSGLASTSNALSLENGYKAAWSGTFSYPAAADGQKTPTSVSGSWTALPAAGAASAVYNLPLTAVDKTVSAVISAPKTGLMVSGSDVKPASGNDTKTATATVKFFHRRYYGLTTAASVTGDVVKALAGTDLNNTKTAKLTGISATDAQYYVIAYPKAMGELTKIVQNGATPLLSGGFVKSEVTVVNAAGASIAYLVYRTEKPGALKDSSYLEIG